MNKNMYSGSCANIQKLENIQKFTFCHYRLRLFFFPDLCYIFLLFCIYLAFFRFPEFLPNTVYNLCVCVLSLPTEPVFIFFIFF